jgi:hypothetical protein
MLQHSRFLPARALQPDQRQQHELVLRLSAMRWPRQLGFTLALWEVTLLIVAYAAADNLFRSVQ